MYKTEPGVMHPIDEAFYKLAIKERDYERRKADRLQQEVDWLRQQLTIALGDSANTKTGRHILGLEDE